MFNAHAAPIILCCALTAPIVGRATAVSTNVERSHAIASQPVPADGRSIASVRTTDDPIRTVAEKTVLPRYPENAIRRGVTGVAVAMVYLDEHRRVQRVEILEAPSAEIATAVMDAVRQWRFRSFAADPPDFGGRGRKLKGKVTFYFFRSTKGYEVAGPKDAPNIRR